MDYDDRRDAIVQTAARLYAEMGFLGCSIADLSAACGMSKSLLYHYFASKEDILFAIMAGHVEALRQVADGIVDVADASQRLRDLTHGFVHLYVGASAQHKVLVNDLDKLPAERSAMIIETERSLLDIVDGIIVELAPSLKSQRSRRRAITMLYFGMINWMHTWFDAAKDVGPDEFADLVVAQFVNGLPRG